MPRTKGSKNRPKINTTKDYATQIAEKQEIISQRYECGRDPRKTEIKPKNYKTHTTVWERKELNGRNCKVLKRS